MSQGSDAGLEPAAALSGPGNSPRWSGQGLCGLVDTVPPAAAEGLEQRGGVAEALGLRLHPAITACCSSARKSARRDRSRHRPCTGWRDLHAVLRRLLISELRLQRIGVRLDGAQRVRHIAERGNDRALVGGEACSRLAMPLPVVIERAAVEHRLRQTARDAPGGRSGREQAAGVRPLRP